MVEPWACHVTIDAEQRMWHGENSMSRMGSTIIEWLVSAPLTVVRVMKAPLNFMKLGIVIYVHATLMS